MKAKTYVIATWLIAVVLLGATWAATSSTGTVTISAGGVGGGDLAAVITDPAKIGVSPSWKPIAGAVGAIPSTNAIDGKNGSLYGITVPDSGRYMATIFFTNPDKLSGAYSYLNLNVAIYKVTNASTTLWTYLDPANKVDSEYITLSSARVVLYFSGASKTTEVSLDGYRYVVYVPNGVFYCTNAANAVSNAPLFYIMVDQA